MVVCVIMGVSQIEDCILQKLHFSAATSSNGAFPLHGTARYGTVRFTFGGFSTGYCTWYLIIFKYHFGRGSMRAVPLPKRDV